jgi:large subunit ribosomal protein L30e
MSYKSTLKALHSNKAKVVIITGKIPQLRKSELEYYAMLSKCNVHHFAGNNVSLLRCRHLPPRLRKDTAVTVQSVTVVFLNTKKRTSRLMCCLQIDLGTACGKLFHVSTMAVIDQGDSDILSTPQ